MILIIFVDNKTFDDNVSHECNIVYCFVVIIVIFIVDVNVIIYELKRANVDVKKYK